VRQWLAYTSGPTSKLPTLCLGKKERYSQLFPPFLDNISRFQALERSVFAHFLIINGIYLHVFTIVGQFPINDGLFAAPRLAYFSTLPLSPKPARPELELVVP
jgi:hypothetical protein